MIENDFDKWNEIKKVNEIIIFLSYKSKRVVPKDNCENIISKNICFVNFCLCSKFPIKAITPLNLFCFIQYRAKFL